MRGAARPVLRGPWSSWAPIPPPGTPVSFYPLALYKSAQRPLPTARRALQRFDEEGYRTAKNAGHRVSEAEFTKTAHLALTPTPLPGTVDDVRQDISVETRRLQAHLKQFMGAAKVLRQEPTSAPKEPKRSPKPLCHAQSEERWLWYKNMYRAIQARFSEASHQFRRGHFDVPFPRFTFRPTSTVG